MTSYVYIVHTPVLFLYDENVPIVKVGIWSGTVKNLFHRYMTCYGARHLSIWCFECSDIETARKVESNFAIKFEHKNWSNELYKYDQTFPDFIIEECNINYCTSIPVEDSPPEVIKSGHWKHAHHFEEYIEIQ